MLRELSALSVLRCASAMSAQAFFRFFPAAPPLSAFVDYLYFSEVRQAFTSQIEAVRLPELEAQLVFAIAQPVDGLLALTAS
jgi:hypothetical protein